MKRILVGLWRWVNNIALLAWLDPLAAIYLTAAQGAIFISDVVYLVLLKKENRPWNIPDEFD